MIGLEKPQENNLNNIDNLEITEDIDETEMICDKCNGKGVISLELTSTISTSVCPKCQGDGKVDWISNIMGKPTRTSHMNNMTTSTTVDVPLYGYKGR